MIKKHLVWGCLFLSACASESLEPPRPSQVPTNAVTETVSAPSAVPSEQKYKWALPPGFPEPFVPKDNPMSQAKVELGRYLFYDKKLSRDQSQSCASCHQQSKAFSDGLKHPRGITGEAHPRNSMPLANAAYASVLTWANPHMKDLESQMLVPIFGEEPVELGMAGHEKELLARLQKNERYVLQFDKAFPTEKEPINLKNITKAIASFERSLISANSPYDQQTYLKKDVLSPEAQAGQRHFFSEKFECFHCHGGFLFSDSSRHAKSAFLEFNFHNNGLYNLDGKGAYPFPNTGVYEITHQDKDMGRFKAPSLRNIAVTAPYMHDGSIATLEEVLEHYARGGRQITEGPLAGDGRQHPNKSGFIKGFDMSPQEKMELLAFLNSLTDIEFLNHPAHSDPFQK